MRKFSFQFIEPFSAWISTFFDLMTRHVFLNNCIDDSAQNDDRSSKIKPKHEYNKTSYDLITADPRCKIPSIDTKHL